MSEYTDSIGSLRSDTVCLNLDVLEHIQIEYDGESYKVVETESGLELVKDD
jgi:hypothetical protein